MEPPFSTNSARIQAFRQGLRELGYVEGKISSSSIAGRKENLNGFLPRSRTSALLKSTSLSPLVPLSRDRQGIHVQIPIVLAFDNDPVGSGFVASLARPGGNITGLSALLPELSGKRLEILKEVIPTLSRMVVLGTSTQPGTTQALREIELASEAFGVKQQFLDMGVPRT